MRPSQLLKTPILAIGGFAFALNATAQLITETFTYDDGPLVTRPGTPWVTTSGTANQQGVVAGQLFLEDSDSEDTARPLGETVVSGSLSASFDLLVPSIDIPSSLAGTDLYFTHFLTPVISGQPTNNVARVTVLDGGDLPGPTNANDTTFTLGVSTLSGTATAQFADGAFNIGQTYRLTLIYDFATGIASLTVGASTITATDTFFAVNGLDRYAFRQAGGASGDFFVDNLVVIPEPATTVTLLGGLALLGLMRRRRA